MRTTLRSGVISGAVGGTAMVCVLVGLGEGPLGRAIAYEAATSPVTEEHLSRTTQQIGGAIAIVLYGIAMGAVLGTAVSLFLRGDDRSKRSVVWGVVAVGVSGFLCVSAIPFLKYPPNPPGVKTPDDISSRTLAYVAAIVSSIVAVLLARWTWHFCRKQLARGLVLSAIAGVAAYALLVSACLMVLPDDNSISEPHAIVTRFRIISIVGSATYWAVASACLAGLLLSRRNRLARHQDSVAAIVA